MIRCIFKSHNKPTFLFKLDWSEDEDKEVQKIAYKRQILAELGLDK
ncbi:nitrate/sulfonate/bicarbonate ABC transporter ATP-binding protein [Streptococcus pneumoniae]|nr:nitrate/sulfonate/bicarbonate ABC transporter ATP-binding protein [Streptococcus pneumoniae]